MIRTSTEFALGAIVALVPRPWLRRVGALVSKAQLNETDLLVAICGAMGLRGVFVDVGARYGTSLAPFARAGWQVLAFEPDPHNRKVLEALRRWLPGVKLDSRALSDETIADATLFTSAGRSSISSLLPFDDSHVPSVTVEVAKLNEAATDYDLVRIDVLKIDAEGNDLRVLRGADLNGRLRPTVIMCEFDGRKVPSGGHTYEDLTGFLASEGYELVVSEWFPVEEYGGGHQWRAAAWYPHSVARSDSHGNVIAIDRAASPGSEVRNVVEAWAESMGALRG